MKKQIEEILKISFKKMDILEEIELTEAKGHADFATNFALKNAKKYNMKPLELANQLISKIDSPLISRMEVAGPGFINIFLNDSSFAPLVDEIIQKGNDYGRGNENQYINIEYVSANPTGYLHVGHARSAVLGSTLANILKFAGNKVDTEFYTNDAGNQINLLAESTRVRYLQELGQDIEMPEDSYAGYEIKELAKLYVKKYKDTLKDLDHSAFKEESVEFMLKNIKEHLLKYRVEIDHYFSEKSIYQEKKIPITLKKLANYTYEKDGAVWLKTKDMGDDKDRVLIKSDGLYTYFMPDIAYHDIKLSRGYDELINIWGADHIGYIKRLQIALELLGLPKNKLDILVVQLVKLTKDGKEVKMSKRAGTSYTIKDLLEEVGVDAARWFMIERASVSEFVFDINLATKKSNDNPVFSVQYSHARAHQLIKKSKVNSKPGKYSENEKIIINHLIKFPEIISTISKTHKVHLLPKYLLELSSCFNSWYSNHKLIGTSNEASLKALVVAVKQVIKNGLELMNITAPEEM